MRSTRVRAAIGVLVFGLGIAATAGAQTMEKVDYFQDSIAEKGDLNHIIRLTGGSSWVLSEATLAAIASACRDHQRLSFAYRDQRDQRSAREIEPMRLVHTGRVWYLAAWDIAREDWRTFRVDRIDGKTLSEGGRFVPRPAPEDFAEYVSRSIASARHEHRARVEVKGAIKELEKKIPSWVGVLESAGKDRCVLTVGGETLDSIAALLILSGMEFTLLDPPELAAPLKAIAARLSRGALRRSPDEQGRITLRR